MTEAAFEGIERARTEGAPDWTRDAARDLTDRSRQGIEQASEYVRDALGRTRETLSQYRDAGVERAGQDIVRAIREQPLTTLLVGLGAGLLIGWLTTLRRR